MGSFIGLVFILIIVSYIIGLMIGTEGIYEINGGLGVIALCIISFLIQLVIMEDTHPLVGKNPS